MKNEMFGEMRIVVSNCIPENMWMLLTAAELETLQKHMCNAQLTYRLEIKSAGDGLRAIVSTVDPHKEIASLDLHRSNSTYQSKYTTRSATERRRNRLRKAKGFGSEGLPNQSIT